MWTAMRSWRTIGAPDRFNFGGGGDYKAKYGGEPAPSLPHGFRRSRPALLEHARAALLRHHRP